jgi:hypothetical protein
MTPVLVVAGAQKSASTSVAAWLASSTRVAQLGGLECLAFEGRQHVRRTRTLQRQVASCTARHLLPILKRPEILHVPVLRARMVAAFPDATALVILRHPVDRSISAWHHYRRMGVINPDVKLRDCVKQWRESGNLSPAGQIIGFSRYATALARLAGTVNTFPTFHDDVVEAPREAFSPVLEQFMTPGSLPATLPELNRVEPGDASSSYRPRIAGRLSYRWNGHDGVLQRRNVLSRAGALAVGRWRTDDRAVVDQSDRLAAREATIDDLDVLEEVIGRRVPPGWRNS